jgi:hypothetical protein
VLLVAALAMVLETACSQAPPPNPDAEVHNTAKHFQSKHTAALFHLVNGTTYATSNYAVQDSFVVINQILRDSKYYEPTSYDKANATPPPANATVPVKIPMREIASVEKWEPVVLSNDSKKGLFIVGGILVGLIAALAIVIIQNNNE